jgi:hypothetical protein
MEKIFIPDPPPLIKDRIPRGARNRSRAVDQSAFMTAVQMSALFIINSEPPPPPPIKGRTAGGVRNPLWTVDLSAGLRAVQICSKLIINSGPPPSVTLGKEVGKSKDW